MQIRGLQRNKSIQRGGAPRTQKPERGPPLPAFNSADIVCQSAAPAAAAAVHSDAQDTLAAAVAAAAGAAVSAAAAAESAAAMRKSEHELKETLLSAYFK